MRIYFANYEALIQMIQILNLKKEKTTKSSSKLFQKYRFVEFKAMISNTSTVLLRKKIYNKVFNQKRSGYIEFRLILIRIRVNVNKKTYKSM